MVFRIESIKLYTVEGLHKLTSFLPSETYYTPLVNADLVNVNV